jgi:hypothetical protein
MLNGITKQERLDRTIEGVRFQVEDFFYIIENHIKSLSEKEMQGLYELEEDIKNS